MLAVIVFIHYSRPCEVSSRLSMCQVADCVISFVAAGFCCLATLSSAQNSYEML